MLLDILRLAAAFGSMGLINIRDERLARQAAASTRAENSGLP